MDTNEIVEKINLFEKKLYEDDIKDVTKNLKKYLKYKEEYSKKIKNKDS